MKIIQERAEEKKDRDLQFEIMMDMREELKLLVLVFYSMYVTYIFKNVFLPSSASNNMLKAFPSTTTFLLENRSVFLTFLTTRTDFIRPGAMDSMITCF